jgi:hypothetical protein
MTAFHVQILESGTAPPLPVFTTFRFPKRQLQETR